MSDFAVFSSIQFPLFSSSLYIAYEEKPYLNENPGKESTEKPLDVLKRSKHIIEGLWLSDVLQQTLKEVDMF